MTTITVAGNGTGMSVTDGTVRMIGVTTINVTGSGTGMSVSNGTVTMSGETTITGRGGSGKGVVMSGGTVMMENVNISEFTTGITMTGGESLTVDGGSIVGSGGVMGTTGINVTGGSGNVTVKGEAAITGFATGINMMGDGSLTVSGGTTIKFTGTYGVMVGESVKNTSLTDVMITGESNKGVGVKVMGGTVVMEKVTISKVETGVEMGDKVTNASLTNVNISKVEKGIVMEGSGAFTVSGTTIQFTGDGYGVMVGSSVRSTSLTNVTITRSGGSGGYGVYVTGGGDVTVKGVTMNQVGTGIMMTGGESLTVNGGSIGFTDNYGVMVGVEGTANLTDVKITGSGRGGVGVYAMGGEVTMKQVDISNVGMGIWITGGSLTAKEGTTIQFEGEDGYGIKVGSSVKSTELTGVEISGGGSGMGVYAEGGNLTVKGMTTITGVKVGISMKGSGVLTVSGTTIQFTGSESYEYGIGVGSSVSKAALTDVKIEGQNKGIGVLIMGGEVTMERVNVSNVGMGVYATGGKNLTVIGGAMTQVQTGITMMGGALTVRDSTRIWFTKDYGIKVGKGVTEASLTKVEIVGKGSGTGIYAEGGVLMVSGGTKITGVERGITMTGYGVLKVKDKTTIGFTGEHGVYVGESVAKAELTGVEIAGSQGNGTGIYAEGGSLTVSGGSIKEVATGIWVTGGSGTVTVKDNTTITGVKMGIFAMGGGSLTVEEGTRIGFTGNYGVMVGESGMATLMGVTIEGKGSGTGIYAMGGVLMVSGGSITGVKEGIMMMGYGVLKVRDNTRIWFTKDYGVVVGESVASTTLTNVQIEGKGSGGNGTGIYAMGGSLTVSGGSITGVEEGIKMMGGKNLTVKDGTRIEFTGGGYGVLVGGVTSARLTGAVITGRGDGYGVYVTGGKNLTVTLGGVNISNVGMGVWVGGGESLTINGDSTVKFTKAYGVYVGYKVKKATLTEVTISGENKGIGVYAEGEKMMMTKVNISQVQTGIYAEGGAMWLKETHLRDVAKGMTISKGFMRMEGGSVEFKGEHGISFIGGYAALRRVNMTYKSDGLNANFIKVEGGKVLAENLTITGNGGKGQGVKVANGGTVWLKETNFTNVKSGMTVGRGGVMRMEGGSITFNGGHG
ncbi:beta strand repeat-containing protein [Bartonella schoenbuchensis]|uniref:beta strand repeat-containing protein n=1 Tax=Bartonella schoenbuchensis TaxID=165694 RepID=UPI0031450609